MQQPNSSQKIFDDLIQKNNFILKILESSYPIITLSQQFQRLEQSQTPAPTPNTNTNEQTSNRNFSSHDMSENIRQMGVNSVVPRSRQSVLLFPLTNTWTH